MTRGTMGNDVSKPDVLAFANMPPSPDELYKEWQVCNRFFGHQFGFCKGCERRPRTYRLLVEWMRAGKFKGDWIDDLPMDLRQVYEKYCPHGSALGDRFLPSPHCEQHHSRLSQEDLKALYGWLLLAWCVRKADHATSLCTPSFENALGTLRANRADVGTILDLTYVPREILERLPDLRKSLEKSRRQLSRSLRSYRQKIAQGKRASLVGPSNKAEEMPPSAGWEQRWSSSLGMDKLTSAFPKQILWTLVFVPVVKVLLPYAKQRKRDRWHRDSDEPILPDDVFKKASHLIHSRYPDLWEDRWQRVRDRCAPHLRS